MTETFVAKRRLIEAVWKALGGPPAETQEGIDYYCTVVADAADLPVEEVQNRLRQKDTGIMIARAVVKNLLFMRYYGVSPEKAME